MTSWVSGIVAALAISVLCAPKAEAIAIVSFDQSNPIAGGAISYDGTGGSLIGSNIPFDRLGGLGTPLNSGATSLCVGCLLNFTTGANISEGPGVYEWGGAPLGSFTLTGSLPFLPAPGPIGPPAEVLLTGTISAARLDTGLLILGLRGIDFKHPKIVDFYFGPGPDPIFSYINTQIIIGGIDFDDVTDPGGADGGFNAAVTNADIDNVIPEPGSALLLLLGLGSLAAYRRRRN
jgi:hypothetical protein